jgi:hypothetical protein
VTRKPSRRRREPIPPLPAWRLFLDIGVAPPDSSLTLAGIADQPALLEQKRQVTGRISETMRTLAFGSLASCYALLVANRELAASFAEARSMLIWCAGTAIAAIIVDSAQYLFGYINIQQALRRPNQDYPTNWSRKARAICFVLKQVLVYLAAILLLGAVMRVVL